MTERAVPEEFSYQNAVDSVMELLKALPKTKQGMYAYEANQALVVLKNLWYHSGLEDKNKSIER